MNERIKQLALEARLGPALLLHHWGNYDLTDSEQEALEQIEKFAQLIVQECANIADEYDGVGSTIVGRIEKHFGVEE